MPYASRVCFDADSHVSKGFESYGAMMGRVPATAG